MQLKQSDRRTIVEDLLDIQIFSSMNGILKTKSSELKTGLQDNENKRELNRSKTKMQRGYIERLKQDNEIIISNKTEDIQDYEKQKNVAVDSLNLLHSEILTLNEKMGSKNTTVTKNSEFNSLQNKIEMNLKHDEKELAFYEKNSTCSQCKQDIDNEFKKEKIIGISKGIDEKKDGLDKIYTELEILELKLEEFKTYNNQITEKNRNLAGIESSVQSLDGNIERIRKEIELLRDKKKLDNTEIDVMSSLESELTELTAEFSKLCDEKQLYSYAHELLRDSGIKTKIIRQYVPIINKYVNKYLNELDFLINFSIDENFNETIQSQYRDEFSYASFSEGEKMRIDLALLFTWRMVAKLKNSVNTNILILDEVFDSSLDAEGTDAFLKIINTLDADTNVFVISHKGEILFDKFLSTIKFVKEKQFSKIGIS
jgi:DNA repair exonuclease SbcCD ATPase subunit